MKVSFKVEAQGFRDLDNALGELPKATAKNVMKRSLLKAAEPIMKFAQSLAPYATGLMQRRIQIGTKLSKRQARLNRHADEKSYTEVYIGPPSSSDISRMQEFGTHDAAPHPYMRPAFDAEWRTALEIMKTELQMQIEKAVARFARKAAREAAKLRR